MRTPRFTTWLVLGIAVTLAYLARRRRRAPWRRAAPPPPEPEPESESEHVQCVPAVTSDQELARIASSIDEVGGLHVEELSDEAEVAVTYGDLRAPLGSGELYDVHIARAVDRELPDDDQAQDEGEHWLEHLEASAAEFGPEPEHMIDLVDDSDLHTGHHKTDTRDTPVADRGSAGPRGL